jgi:glutathione S-transferase
MKLLASHNSPYARKVRIVLEETGIPYELVIDRPSEPNSKVADFNPLGKVPVLVRDDGTSIYDSPVIVEYLNSLAPPTSRVLPEAFADRIEVKRWEALGDGIIDATVAISHDFRLPEVSRHPPEWHSRQQKKIDRGLATMEKDLGQREFCFGAAFGLADIACGVALGYLDGSLPKLEWRASHPGLRRHADRLFVRPSFKKTLPPAG